MSVGCRIYTRLVNRRVEEVISILACAGLLGGLRKARLRNEKSLAYLRNLSGEIQGRRSRTDLTPLLVERSVSVWLAAQPQRFSAL